MIQSPIDDNLVVFIGKYYFLFEIKLCHFLTSFLGSNGINWVTDDCGANLRALNSGKRIHEFHYHPK